MGAFIEAEDVRKTYRVGKIEVRALRGISFTVRRGEFVSGPVRKRQVHSLLYNRRPDAC